MASSHKHNATGRSVQPSKAQRQAAMNPRHTPTVAQAPTPEPESKTEQTPATQTTTEAPATAVVPFSSKGAAMRTRWSAVLKSRPGAKLIMPADIKALPRDSKITSLVPGNPKRRNAADRYALYGFNMEKGASTTIEKYVAAVTKVHRENFTEGVALADVAWDINHGFIQVEVTTVAPVTETNTEQVVAEAHDVAVAEHKELDPNDKVQVPEATPELEGERETTQATIDAEPIDPSEDNEEQAA